MVDQAEVVKRMRAKMLRLKEWLYVNAPNIDDEQKHLDSGTEAQIYWHAGYVVALQDVMRNFGFEKAPLPTADTAGTK